MDRSSTSARPPTPARFADRERDVLPAGRRQSSSPINYQFRLTDTAYSPLSFGTTINGTSHRHADRRLQLHRHGRRAHLLPGSLSESNGYLRATWVLYGPNNRDHQRLASAATSRPRSPPTAPIRWWSPTTPATQCVDLQLRGLPECQPDHRLTLGQEVTGTIANPGDQATYTFTGSPGQRIYFDSLARHARPTGRPHRPVGNKVFTGTLSSGDQGPFTLTRSGTYTLTISELRRHRGLRLHPGRRRDGDDHRPDARRGHGRDRGRWPPASPPTSTSSPAPPASRSTSRGSRTPPASGAVASLYNPTATATPTTSYLENAAPGDAAERRDLPPGGRGANAAERRGQLQLRGLRQCQPDRGADPGPGGDRDPRQPRRQGHLHLHRHGRPAALLRRPRPPRRLYAALHDPFGIAVFNGYLSYRRLGPFTLTERAPTP